MAFITINHHAPADNGAAFVAENATLAGSVRLEKNSSVWYGAVLRADTGRIAIGENSNVQDSAVLHTGPGLDVTVGRGTSVGHGAVVHGCTVGDGCLIGMHATILNGAVIGDGCLIAAGALVPENMQVPAGSLVIGVPGKVVRPVSAPSRPTKKNIWNWRGRTRRQNNRGMRFCRRRRAASPLAAAEGSRPLPTNQPLKGCQRQSCRPGMPGPYRTIKKQDAVLRNGILFFMEFTSAPHPDWRW